MSKSPIWDRAKDHGRRPARWMLGEVRSWRISHVLMGSGLTAVLSMIFGIAMQASLWQWCVLVVGVGVILAGVSIAARNALAARHPSLVAIRGRLLEHAAAIAETRGSSSRSQSEILEASKYLDVTLGPTEVNAFIGSLPSNGSDINGDIDAAVVWLTDRAGSLKRSDLRSSSSLRAMGNRGKSSDFHDRLP